MPQVLFDTHAAARKLEKAGHTAQQAEAVVEVVSKATEFGARMQRDVERIKYVVENHMATKDDLAGLRAATKDDLAGLRAATKDDLAGLRAATKDDITELRMSTKDDISELRTATKEDISELRAATKEDIAELCAATKEDISELRAATKEDISELRAATKEDITELRMSTKDDLAGLRADIARIPQVVREALRQETPMIQLRSMIAAGSLTFSLGGFAVMALTNERLAAMALEHGSVIGLLMIMAGSAVMMFLAWAGRSG